MKTIKYIILCVLSLPVFGMSQTQMDGKTLFGAIRARQIGPATMSGRISDLAVVNSDPTIMYVGAAGGGAAAIGASAWAAMRTFSRWFFAVIGCPRRSNALPPSATTIRMRVWWQAVVILTRA